MSSRIVRLRSADGHLFEVDEKAAAVSQAIKHMIEDGMADGDKIIPLPNVTSGALAKVLEYCGKHADDAGSKSAVAGSSNLDSFAAGAESESVAKLKDWDANFIKVADENFPWLFEIINVANYLHIKDLQDLAVQEAADMIKDKTVEEVREIFNIENDYTKEEEAEMRRQNYWAFE